MIGSPRQSVAEERSKIYWLLSRLFLSRPDAGLVAELRSWLAAANQDPALSKDGPVRLIGASLEGDDDTEVAERLAREYTRLLRGLKPGYGPPPPFESVYRPSQPLGMVTAEVVRRMRLAGLETVAPETGPQDHIGAELRFMSLLCYRESRAWADRDYVLAESLRAGQRSFLDDHLLQWVPGYCGTLEEAAAEPFYEGLAQMTRDAITQDRRVLDEMNHEAEPA